MGPLGVAGLTTVAFLPTARNGFLNWDDVYWFSMNPAYRGLGWSQLAWMWTTTLGDQYMPLTWMTYGLDYLLWGMSPAGYHVTSLVLHVITAVVVYELARKLLALAAPPREESPPPLALELSALLAALLFAVHPLRAEPVAWLAARGTILGGLWLLLSMLAYLAACTHPSRARWRWLAAALGLFALALLSRATSLVLPALLLVLDVYPLKRLGRRTGWVGPRARPVWLEKLPFVVLALAAVPLALYARYERTPLDDQGGLASGVAVAAFGLTWYLGKTLFVGPLSPLYERPQVVDPLEAPFLASVVFVMVVSAGLVAMRRRWPAALAAWVSYAVVLAPTLGVVPFGMQLVADRWTYLSCIGWAVLGGRALAALAVRERGPTTVRPLGIGLAVVVLLGLGLLSWHQVQVWRDSDTLWQHVVAVDAASAVGHLNLGMLRERDGDLPAAADHYRRALAARPRDPVFHTNLGRFAHRLGRGREAIDHLEQAVRLDPSAPGTHVRLGVVLVAAGRVEEGMAHYREALRLAPGSVMAHFSLGQVFEQRGELALAARHYEAALAGGPGFAQARSGLDRVRAAARRAASGAR